MNIPAIAQSATQLLRDHGYAVALYSPEDLQGVDPQYAEKVLSQAGWEFINQNGLRDYRVTYFEEDDSECQLFECQASDMNHVVEQFEDAYPTAMIMAIEVK